MDPFSFFEYSWKCSSCDTVNESNRFICKRCHAVRDIGEPSVREALISFILFREKRSQKYQQHVFYDGFDEERYVHRHLAMWPFIILNIVYPGLGLLFLGAWVLGIAFFGFTAFVSYFGDHSLLFLIPFGWLLLLFGSYWYFYMLLFIVMFILTAFWYVKGRRGQASALNSRYDSVDFMPALRR